MGTIKGVMCVMGTAEETRWKGTEEIYETITENFPKSIFNIKL